MQARKSEIEFCRTARLSKAPPASASQVVVSAAPQWAPTELVECYSWFLPSACLPPGWHSVGCVCREKNANASIDLSGTANRGADSAAWGQSGIGLPVRVRLRLWWLRLFLLPTRLSIDRPTYAYAIWVGVASMGMAPVVAARP
jgi:hypothetical protein